MFLNNFLKTINNFLKTIRTRIEWIIIERYDNDDNIDYESWKNTMKSLKLSGSLTDAIYKLTWHGPVLITGTTFLELQIPLFIIDLKLLKSCRYYTSSLNLQTVHLFQELKYCLFEKFFLSSLSSILSWGFLVINCRYEFIFTCI